jgi:protein TonB
MNYVATRAKPNPAALAGALGVPAAFAALLVAGLAVTAVAPDFVPNPDAEFVEDEVVEITPTTELPDRAMDPAATTTAPDRPLPPRPDRPETPYDLDATAPIDALPGLGDRLDSDIGEIAPIGPIAPPSFPNSEIAKPKNSPGEWVTDADYRSRWIREGLSGTARFTLAIDATGRVSSCTVTRSSGHAVLDTATCRLIERRARFEPARDDQGNRVAGSYSSAISWTIPD